MPRRSPQHPVIAAIEQATVEIAASTNPPQKVKPAKVKPAKVKPAKTKPARSDPAYRLHKPSGGAVVTLPDGDGRRRDVRLGVYDSPESWAEYYRVLAEWRAVGYRAPSVPHAAAMTPQSRRYLPR